MIAVFFILLVTLAGLGIVVVNALANSPWGVFTIGMTVPIALIMGVWMFKNRAGEIKITGPSIFGVVCLLAAVAGGTSLPKAPLRSTLTFTPHEITLMMVIYGFVASVLPVWLLLEPRDYLSTYVKLGTIAALIIGVFVVHPNIQFPNITPFIHGGGPIIKGKLFPFLFVTIACGAISGFHSLVSSGTTPKMLDKETDARFIGFGAMLCESLVGVLALIAASFDESRRLLRNQLPSRCFCQAGNAYGEPGHVLARSWRKTRGTQRRCSVAGSGNGPDIQRAARHGQTDGLLVPLRHHV